MITFGHPAYPGGYCDDVLTLLLSAGRMDDIECSCSVLCRTTQ